jgi:hypothetical protein
LKWFEGEKGFRKALRILSHMQVDCGVCWCANAISEGKINYMTLPPRWVKKHRQPGNEYWGGKPINATTISEILSRLKLRVDILQKEIQLSK